VGCMKLSLRYRFLVKLLLAESFGGEGAKSNPFFHVRIITVQISESSQNPPPNLDRSSLSTF